MPLYLKNAFLVLYVFVCMLIDLLSSTRTLIQALEYNSPHRKVDNGNSLFVADYVIDPALPQVLFVVTHYHH